MVDGVQLAQEAADLRPPIPSEVGAHPGLDVGGLAHIEHVSGRIGEPVDAGAVGESGGEAQLGRLGVTDQAGEVEQLLEPEDAIRAGPFQ